MENKKINKAYVFIIWATIAKSFVDGRPPQYKGHAALWIADGTPEDVARAQSWVDGCNREYEKRSVFCTDTTNWQIAKQEAETFAIEIMK